MFQRIILSVVILLIAASAAPMVGAVQTGTEDFEMLYEELPPKPRALVDDWIGRYAELRSEELQPEVYDEFPLSVKTTFVAVTHALGHTPLTDESGEPIVGDAGEPMTALDLVAKLDAVKGKVKGARGDEQFRIYVQLIPEARDLLDESTQFRRTRDNTVYHHGYPLNYRSGPGVPSIQFAMAPNGILADIDVDYRSSKIPVALVNGHLSSANSDVRAGNNLERHNEAWAGLANWWSAWEGLGDWFAALYGTRGLDIPRETEKGDGEVEDAVRDFLQSWLVDDRPDIAMSYFAPDVYQCFNEREGEEDTDASVEERMYRKMSETVRVIGNPRSLGQVVQGVVLTSLDLAPIPGNHEQFVLYRVPAERVIEHECGYQNMSIPRARRAQFRRTGDHVLATFFLKSGDVRGVTTSLLWAREDDGWKMVSFELEPAGGLVPDLHAPPQVPSARGVAQVATDAELVSAADAFMSSWFVDDDFETALGFVAPESYRCLDLFAEEEAGASREPSDRFTDVLRSVSEFVGDVDRDMLVDAIAGVEPWSPMLQDVTPDESAATLIAIPDGLADEYRCVDPSAPVESSRGPVEPVYGNFFASAFRLKLAGGEQPATFLVLWGRVDDAWKVIAFEVVPT